MEEGSTCSVAEVHGTADRDEHARRIHMRVACVRAVSCVPISHIVACLPMPEASRSFPRRCRFTHPLLCGGARGRRSLWTSDGDDGDKLRWIHPELPAPLLIPVCSMLSLQKMSGPPTAVSFPAKRTGRELAARVRCAARGRSRRAALRATPVTPALVMEAEHLSFPAKRKVKLVDCNIYLTI